MLGRMAILRGGMPSTRCFNLCVTLNLERRSISRKLSKTVAPDNDSANQGQAVDRPMGERQLQAIRNGEVGPIIESVVLGLIAQLIKAGWGHLASVARNPFRGCIIRGGGAEQ